ncbi:MAG: MXAN_6640 family putative metalloprotease, partial [bacterium]
MMNRCAFVVLLILVLVLAGNVNHSPASDNKIEQGFVQGRISQIERAVLLGYQLFSPDRLPPQYLPESDEILKCGTSIVADLRQNWNRLSPEDRNFFSAYLSRPSLPLDYVSPTGLFKLHYTLTGFSRVSDADLDLSGVPDWVEEAALIFDHCYLIEVDSLGYEVPPADFEVEGPEIDVYIQNIGSYGYTDFDDTIPSTPYNDLTSYIIVDNDFEGSGFFTNGIDGLKVTAAHELFHVVQLGYNFREMDKSFFEMSSTWMEDRVYDEINDYYQYLPSFMLSLNLPLSHGNGAHEYGGSLFIKFLQEAFSETTIRRSWELIRDFHSMNATNAALIEAGSSLETALVEFGLWNYFTGARSEQLSFYKEAANYPQVPVNQVLTFQTDTTIVDSSYYLTLHYYKLRPETSGYYSVAQQHERPEIWQTGVVIENQGEFFINPFAGNTVGQLGLVQGLSDVILIAANTETPETLGESLFRLDKSKFSYQIRRQLLGRSQRVFPNPFNPEQH